MISRVRAHYKMQNKQNQKKIHFFQNKQNQKMIQSKQNQKKAVDTECVQEEDKVEVEEENFEKEDDKK